MDLDKVEVVHMDGCGRYGYSFFEMGGRYKERVGLEIRVLHPLPAMNAKRRKCLFQFFSFSFV